MAYKFYFLHPTHNVENIHGSDRNQLLQSNQNRLHLFVKGFIKSLPFRLKTYLNAQDSINRVMKHRLKIKSIPSYFLNTQSFLKKQEYLSFPHFHCCEYYPYVMCILICFFIFKINICILLKIQ